MQIYKKLSGSGHQKGDSVSWWGKNGGLDTKRPFWCPQLPADLPNGPIGGTLGQRGPQGIGNFKNN